MNALAKAICLDLTRSVRRLGAAPLTGIDRVELAYLDHLLHQDRHPAFGLVRTKPGYLLLDRTGLNRLREQILSRKALSKRDTLSWMTLPGSNERAQAETTARQFAAQRCTRFGLAKLLKKAFPCGVDYRNVGHSNLTHTTLAVFTKHPATTITVLLHDTIPLDFPQFQRPGAAQDFRVKLDAVLGFAHQIDVSSRAVQADLTRHAANSPPVRVAPLGVDLPAPKSRRMQLAVPYFVTLGTIEPRKNHRVLLDAWEVLRVEHSQDTLPKLVVIGRRGWNNDDVFRKLDQMSDPSQGIIELNATSDKERNAWIRGATALLNPSWAEGFGLPVFEAAGAGIPVVAAPLPVFEEWFGDGLIYAAPDKPYQWAQAVNDLLTKTAPTAPGKHSPGIPTWTDHFEIVFPS